MHMLHGLVMSDENGLYCDNYKPPGTTYDPSERLIVNGSVAIYSWDKILLNDLLLRAELSFALKAVAEYLSDNMEVRDALIPFKIVNGDNIRHMVNTLVEAAVGVILTPVKEESFLAISQDYTLCHTEDDYPLDKCCYPTKNFHDHRQVLQRNTCIGPLYTLMPHPSPEGLKWVYERASLVLGTCGSEVSMSAQRASLKPLEVRTEMLQSDVYKALQKELLTSGHVMWSTLPTEHDKVVLNELFVNFFSIVDKFTHTTFKKGLKV